MSKMHADRGHRAPRIDFQVTAEHIATARRQDSEHCMIADALRDQYPDAAYVSVDLATIRFTDLAAGWRYIYLTPVRAQAALVDWDQGNDVEPFRVVQRAAQMTPTAGARRQRSAENKGTGTPRKRRAEAAEAEAVARGGRMLTTSTNGEVPTVVGGRALPLARRGRRREFGLRAFIR